MGRRQNYRQYQENGYDIDDSGAQDNIFRLFVSGIAFREVRVKWKRHVLLVAMALVFLAAAATAAMSVFYAGAVIRPPRIPVPPIKENIAFDFSAVSFKTPDDLTTLRGWWFAPLVPRKPAVAAILVHGFESCRFPFGLETLDLVSAYVQAGFHVLAFDLRNSGDSAPGTSTFGVNEHEDVRGAMAFAHRQGCDEVLLHGFSTGANAALKAASVETEVTVGAAILDSPVVDLARFIEGRLQGITPGLPSFPFRYTVPPIIGLFINGDINDADAIKNMAKFAPRPVLLIHGALDEYLSDGEAQQAYLGYLELAVGQIGLWDVPGAGHAEAFAIDPLGYADRIVAFLSRYYP